MEDRRTNLDRSLPAWLAGLAVLLLGPSPSHADDAVEFNRDVRPILSENCFACHGPDARKREAGLRLDVEDSAKSALESGGRAIVPGDPDASDLIFRVEVDDPNTIMPPPSTGKQLTAEQVQTLRAWVAAGAEWEPHWSLAPPERPTAGSMKGHSAGNPLDAYILRSLEERGLEPAPAADRVTLIRRLSLDLTGLPPTPEEVDAFVADELPDAYERLVDRLLASPRFGERMAIFWLDLVRYADSVGYHGDQEVGVSPFRDYVIRSFNANTPFDRFTIEQIAGDLLPVPTTEQRIAAGYNRLGMMSAEGGVQPKEYLAKYAAERVRNLSGAWLGVTIGCAECHDHKYDPFTTLDFYRLEAFFADIKERGLYSGSDFGPSMPVPTPFQADHLARLDGQIDRVKSLLAVQSPELDADQAAWEREVNPDVDWVPLAPEEARSANGTTLTVLEDGSVLAAGDLPATDTYTLVTRAPLSAVTAIRLEALPDDSLPSHGPGRAGNGNLVLSELKVSLQRAPGATPQPLVLENATASYEQTSGARSFGGEAYSASFAVDGVLDGPKGWAVMGDEGRANVAVFETAIDLTAGPDALLTIELIHSSPNAGHNLGRFRVSVAAEPRPVKAPGIGLPRPVRDVLAIEPNRRDAAQRDSLSAYYRTIAPRLAPERAILAGLGKLRGEVFAGVTTMLATERVEPRPIRVLPRGNWMDDSGEVVEPGVPGVLPQPETSAERRLDRLDLARWLVSPENPLTARTLANRLWALYFGAGLSGKLDDLGSQGEWPSHPDLLEHLATFLVDSGWDLKATIRLILTSDAYRRSSIPTPAQREADPTNRWLARQSRHRLDAELVRDAAMAISGLLVERLGGPSVNPYQPRGYWSFLNFPKREWQDDDGPGLYRRGLYVHWQRQYLYPSLLAFDAPSREECTAQRGRSNTPLQSLTLLNDPAYVEAARAFAERVLREGGSTIDDQIDQAFRLALSRPALESEREVLSRLIADHLAQYQADAEAARALLSVGHSPAPGDLDPAELAAWTDAARVILNLHATITRN